MNLTKNTILLLLPILICSQQLRAQNDTTVASNAKVYIIRATGFGGSLVNFRAWINDSVICRLGNNQYSVHNIESGTYTFYATSFDKYKMKENGFEIAIEKGRTYYMRMVTKKRVFDSYIYIQEITENSAAPLLTKCKLKEKCRD